MRWLAILLLTLTVTPSGAFASELFTLDVPGAISTHATDISETGAVVGWYSTSDGVVHGFLWSKGRFATIDVPNAVRTELWGVNNRGDIVGITSPVSGVSRGFVLRDGIFAALVSPDGDVLLPHDINNRGDIVGSGPGLEGFLLDSRGIFTAIAPRVGLGPGFIGTVEGINDHGTMVGFYFLPTEFNAHGFVLDAHGDAAGFSLSFATAPRGINNAGAIVGSLSPSFAGGNEAFVLDDGATSSVSIPGASSAIAYGINNRGDIVGTYVAGGQNHGFVLRR
jgi:probable HAF family extracellular repeat protein